MAGRGPAPKDDRLRRNEPERGENQPATGVGWQHGDIPSLPDGLMPATIEAWSAWMGAWFAAFWTPADLPGLRQIIRLYDQVERGDFVRGPELRMQMDTYGITPKGQQDRRWKPPEAKPDGQAATGSSSGRYGHLRPVADGA